MRLSALGDRVFEVGNALLCRFQLLGEKVVDFRQLPRLLHLLLQQLGVVSQLHCQGFPLSGVQEKEEEREEERGIEEEEEEERGGIEEKKELEEEEEEGKGERGKGKERRKRKKKG